MRAGEFCPEHRDGYDDCSFLHRPPTPKSRLVYVEPEPVDVSLEDDHGADCLCPDPICRDWFLTNAGRSPYPKA